MPQMEVNIPLGKFAQMINSLSKQELDTLYLLLSEEGTELLDRNNDLKLKREKYLSEDEVFNV